ncbi:hypothetical protein NMY22_g17994 [Coprinellus aureogranulatus]|nr:hypothetical protein NMY22_g17994 [Coprinellus aureogranulatus]
MPTPEDGTMDASLAQSLTPETSSTQLRELSIEGFSIPLTSPILDRSPQVTTLNLPIPPDSDLSRILDMLKNLPLIQELQLHFLEPLRPSQAAATPVPLFHLRQVTFGGDSTAVMNTLSYLRLPATNLALGLICELRSHADPQQEGSNLFRAIGAARCPPATVRQAGSTQEQPFSPHLISLEGSSEVEGLMNMVVYNWITVDDTSWGGVRDPDIGPSMSISAVFRKHRTRSMIDWAQWNPLVVVAQDPYEFFRLTSWSMDELRLFGFLDNRDYSDSLWQLLSKCPSIMNLAIGIAHIPKFLALHSRAKDPAVPPFPSLEELEVNLLGHMSIGGAGELAPPVDRYYWTLLKPLCEALGVRQRYDEKYGIEKEWVLRHLNLTNDRFERQVFVQHVETLLREYRLVGVITSS